MDSLRPGGNFTLEEKQKTFCGKPSSNVFRAWGVTNSLASESCLEAFKNHTESVRQSPLPAHLGQAQGWWEPDREGAFLWEAAQCCFPQPPQTPSKAEQEKAPVSANPGLCQLPVLYLL